MVIEQYRVVGKLDHEPLAVHRLTARAVLVIAHAARGGVIEIDGLGAAGDGIGQCRARGYQPVVVGIG